MTSRQTTGEADTLLRRYMAQLDVAMQIIFAGLVALFIGLVAALGGRRLNLPLAVAVLLVVAGLAAHLLPPIHLMRARRQQQSTFTADGRM